MFTVPLLCKGSALHSCLRSLLCRCALCRGFALHFCLPPLLCRRALRLGSCFCICVGIALLLQMTCRFLLFAYALKASSWRMQGAFTPLPLATRVQSGASDTSSSKERDTSQGSWLFVCAVLQSRLEISGSCAKASKTAPNRSIWKDVTGWFCSPFWHISGDPELGVRANFLAGVLLRNPYPVYRGRYRVMRDM